MDGGGTRMASRLSKRQGPAAVFSGPVRRWRKTWSAVASTSATLSSSRLELYRWMPQESREDNSEDASARPVKFLPLSVVVERRTEALRSAAAAAAARPKKDEQEVAEQTVEPQTTEAKYDAENIDLEKISGEGRQSPDFREEVPIKADLEQDSDGDYGDVQAS